VAGDRVSGAHGPRRLLPQSTQARPICIHLGWHFSDAGGAQQFSVSSPFSLGFAIPPLHVFYGGDFRRLRIDWSVDRYG
jgi:hypothetical protein